MSELQTVYLETTIPSYLTSRPARDLILAGEQLLTHQWWDDRRQGFHLCVSELVFKEVARGDPELARTRLSLISDLKVLAADSEVDRLASVFMRSGLIPKKAVSDAVHVAISCRHEVDILLTWNCRHIANAQILRQLSALVERNGYRLPVVCTPIELMGGYEND